ncbi:SusC/RagA family TonB-linked outer membrane protein [Agriterribacter sp.]|uniref:SusC/RagA family TonB-linked outer membrane protein n=1 Tax=Agriterribacter sp. TaxID=2821509 RepID=UPI002BC346C3|nr:SusC/RagA family TonB-linked outer membrane protein [Agriterribacter sp.]HRP55832.1 SusC/RagA family TonB-linked outer membrane protein [Agriterribacter sp.]
MRKNCLILTFFIATFLCNVSFVDAHEVKHLYDFRVNGIVSDNNGPVAGVTVTEKGTSNATSTNNDGRFSLDVSNANSILVITFVGYKTIEVPVGGRSNISLTIESEAQELSGVVVTALGITREKKSLGYSVEEVAGKEMTRVAQENVLNAMSGKVAGVTINQTGAAGSSVSMIIRGATSLNSDNQPLFVIDGVPVANTINNVTQVGTDNRVDYGNAIGSLNPDDIENVSILKGPSAAALYGSRAGNGVVLITTKSGKGLNKTTVNVYSNTVFDKPYRFLDWQYKYGPGLFSGIPEEVSGSPLTNPLGSIIDEGSVGAFGGELDKGYLARQWNSPLDENGRKIPTELKGYPDNVRNFVQTGITSTNGVSVANNTEKINYRISYSNMQNRGIIPNSDLFRNTLNINSSLKVSKKFTLSTSLDLSRNNSNNRPASERGTNPLQWAYNIPPHINILDLKDYWEPGQEGIQQRSPRNGVIDNPWFLAYEVSNSFVRDRLYGNIKADWQLAKDLTLMLRYGLDTYSEERESKVPYSYTEDARGAYGVTNIKHFESNADFLLSYKKSLGDFHISVSGGGNVRRQNGSTVRNATINGTGLIVPGVYTLQNILPANLDFSNWRSKRGVNSLYAMGTFGYKDMVYLDVTGRNDWSSTLLNAKPYFYPSASLSVLANEIFGITSSDINLVKLRGGYAQVGNDASPYSLYAIMINGGTWGDVPRLTTSSSLYNQWLKPELATSYEMGIDVALFKNRFRASATYYVLDNKNQIFNTPLTSSGGYTSEIINAGLLRSKGIELSVGGTPVQTRSFRWDISANLTRNRTKIISLPEEMPFFTFWQEAKGGAWTYPGEEVGDIYAPEIRVVEDKGSPYYGYPLLQLDPDNGWATYAVAKEDQASRNKVGNFNPRFIMGVQNSVSWKSWSLNFTLDWRNGGQFVSQTYRYGMSDGQTLLPLLNAMDAGLMTGKELRDYLVANADELIMGKNGYSGTIIGWPTPERTSFPIYYQTVLPYGGVIVPGVYATAWDDEGNPTAYEENLGENINPTPEPGAGSGTQPVPYAAGINWELLQPTLFSASYLKLREVSLTYSLPISLIRGLRLQDASFSIYSRNIMLWTAAKINIDPENAFQPSANAQGGTQLKQGIERYNVTPWVIPIGIKLNLTF